MKKYVLLVNADDDFHKADCDSCFLKPACPSIYPDDNGDKFVRTTPCPLQPLPARKYPAEIAENCVDKLNAKIYKAAALWDDPETINNFDFSLRSFQKLAQKYDCFSFIVDIDPGCIADGYIPITVYNDYIE